MLILTRRITESFHVGDEVTVTVLGIKGKQIRLGITAPRGVPVDRHEIRLRKQRDAEQSLGLLVPTGEPA